jgi:hypothetical protein
MGAEFQVEISQSELVRKEQMRTSMCLHTFQQELRVRDIRVKNLERARKNLYQQKRRQLKRFLIYYMHIKTNYYEQFLSIGDIANLR